MASVLQDVVRVPPLVPLHAASTPRRLETSEEEHIDDVDVRDDPHSVFKDLYDGSFPIK